MLNIRMKSQVGGKLLGVTLLSLLVALVGLLLVMQYLATRQVLEWHRQRVELVARLVLAEYIGKIHRVEQAANLLADNPTYGELLAAGNVEALRSLVTPMMKATGLNILTITDYQGVIEVRAHDPGALGVNISSNPLVRASLKGKEATRMTTWKDSVALSASAPIHLPGQDRGRGPHRGARRQELRGVPVPARAPRWPSSTATAWWSIPSKTCRKTP